MSNYTIGRQYEYKTKRLLEKYGYSVLRAAGSHGPWDLVAIGNTGVVLVQVKVRCKPDKQELRKMREFKAPERCVKRLVVWDATGDHWFDTDSKSLSKVMALKRKASK